MEKFGDFVKNSVLNFKLELCCFVASVRTGALTLACLNVILGLIVLVNLSAGEEASFQPLLLQAFAALTDIEEHPPNFTPSCVVAYTAEIASNALVICAMWRNDLILLRAYLYYALGVLTAAIMVYSVVIGALDLVPELLIVASLATQLYQILLVRSAMVEIKHASIKNGYTVNLRPSDSESGLAPNEKYTVFIEPEKPKRPLVLPINKDDISKPVQTKTSKQEKEPVPTKTINKESKETSVTVHSPAKEAFLQDKEAKEMVKPLRFVKEKAKIGESEAKLEKIEKRV